MPRKLIAALLVCAALPAVGQSIYSWKDSSGQVHYSDTPPPEGNTRTLKRTPLAPAAKATSAADQGSPAAPSAAEQELAFRKRRAEAAEADEKARKDKARDEERQRDCADAKAQLAGLESGQRLTRFTANGEKEYLDDEQRAIEKALATQV